jgi:glycosyltransferase involved in cell wall biosynthesis
MLTRLVTAQRCALQDVIVVCLRLGMPSYAEQLRREGVTVIELNFEAIGGIALGLRLVAKLIAETEPDIVQGWMYHGDLVALIALLMSGRRRRTHLIWSIRCSDMDLRLYRVGLRLVLNACIAMSRFPDVITANSAAGLKSHLRLGYRPRRADVIANGIDVDRFKPDAAARVAVRGELGISSEAIVVAHVARVDPMKGHDTFLAAMTALPEVRALLIGDGTENLPAAPNIAGLGRRGDVARLLAASDIVVSSSAFGEGFSNALGEGMACGLPAVATDVGDAALIVGDAGLVVPPNDPRALAAAIRQLAREGADARAKRSLCARARIVENFGMERAIEHYAALYASLGSPQD